MGRFVYSRRVFLLFIPREMCARPRIFCITTVHSVMWRRGSGGQPARSGGGALFEGSDQALLLAQLSPTAAERDERGGLAGDLPSLVKVGSRVNGLAQAQM